MNKIGPGLEQHDSFENVFSELDAGRQELYHTRDGLGPREAELYHYFTRGEIYAPLFEIVRKCIKPGARIVDLGSGRGFDTNTMHELFPECEILGIEISESGVAISKQYEEEGLSYEQGDVTNLKYPDESFDMVFSHAVIEHVSQPEKMLAEAGRILKSDGYMVITTSSGSYYSSQLMSRELAARLSGKTFYVDGFDVNQLRRLIVNAGFEISGFAGLCFQPPQNFHQYVPGVLFPLYLAWLRRTGRAFRLMGLERYNFIQVWIAHKGGGNQVLFRRNKVKNALSALKYIPDMIVTAAYLPAFWAAIALLDTLRWLKAKSNKSKHTG